MKFTEEQIEYLSDKLINMIAPITGYVYLARLHGTITKEELTKIDESVERAVRFIRNLKS